MAEDKKREDENAADQRDLFFFRYRPAFFGGFEPEGGEPSVPQLRPSIGIWTKHPADTEINYSTEDDSYCIVDLAKTPSSSFRKEDVEVDDPVNGFDGFTTIGPMPPHAYGAGSVYLRLPPPPNSNCAAVVIPSEPNDKISTDQTAIVLGRTLDKLERYHGFLGIRLTAPQPSDANPAESAGYLPSPSNLWVVYHPGSASHEHVRAPRKLIVPAASQLGKPFALLRNHVGDDIITRLSCSKDESTIPAHAARAAADSGQEVAIYLERDYALYVAALDVPKKPSGCSEAEDVRRLQRQAAAAANAKNQANASAPGAVAGAAACPSSPSILNVVGSYIDCIGAGVTPPPGAGIGQGPDKARVIATGEIDIIASRIYQESKRRRSGRENLVQLGRSETLFDALSRHAEIATQKYDYLDLIGHSRAGDNILKLGEFALTSRVAGREFSRLVNGGILEKLGIKAIRLLGCRTACSARGRHVVKTILSYFDGEGVASTASLYPYPVYASRADLFAVHFDEAGLLPDAELLLADSDVITGAGPGDLPPGDDYPPDPPSDDDDDDDGADGANGADGADAPVESGPPAEFSIATLSDCNAAIVAAGSYFYWPEFETQFQALKAILNFNVPMRDNPLLKATCEVVVPVSREQRSIHDLRSFDVMLEEEPARIRVYTSGGDAYAFNFKDMTRAKAKAFLSTTLGLPLPEAPAGGRSVATLSPELTSWI